MEKVNEDDIFTEAQLQLPLKNTAKLDLDETQLRAVALACDVEKRVIGITGQAGTGKTTIMRQVYYALIDAGYLVALCAPTGKAAKRIFEATGILAVTIHRLLEYPHPGERDKKTGKALRTTDPKRHRYNPLEYDIVLADEYAMVNQEVHRNLVNALPRSGCLRCFGDINQLTPIEKNKKLAEMPSSFQIVLATLPSVTLETIHRQDEGSGIVVNGARILQGRMPLRTSDFVLKLTTRPIDMLRTLVMEKKEEGIDFSTIDHQVISPTNRSWVGVHKLNPVLQHLFRDELHGWYSPTRHTWAYDKTMRIRSGDKVIWMENDYNVGIFNGETGVVVEILGDEVIIDLGDRVVSVPPLVEYYDAQSRSRQYNPQRSIDLAYCVTTHKSQGSEFGEVIYILNRSSFFMQTRGNFYTAITRARRRVTLVSDQGSLSTSVSRTKTVHKAKKRSMVR